MIVSNDKNEFVYLSTRELSMGKANFWNAGNIPDITPQKKKLF